MTTDHHMDDVLRQPGDTHYSSSERANSSYLPLHTFDLEREKHYQQQFGDLYFLRLAKLKPAVELSAAEAWEGFQIAGETVRRVDRVLDVRQGEFCWVAGTVYMDMPLKPNILDDISKDHWTAAPPPRRKYLSPDGKDQVMLEDESGRLRLIGSALNVELLVTGCIIAVMGTENANGDFEVVDIQVPNLPRQPQRWEQDDIAASTEGGQTKDSSRTESGKVAIVSGLGISGDEVNSLTVDLLMEYLLGEAASTTAHPTIPQISRLIIAGNSLAEAQPLPVDEEAAAKKSGKKYGYDASTYNPAPTAHLDAFLAALLPSLPITLIPGASDPANVSLPQQPMHMALLPESRAYSEPPAPTGAPSKKVGWLDAVTNPWQGDVQGWRLLGTGGQPVDDMYKYVEGDDRLDMMERLLRWRCCAPTAPDTLWCYPFQSDDPFVLTECPHVFFVGNQPRFGTTVIHGPAGQQVRLIAVPKFKETGELVLLDLDTLKIELVRFDVTS
ncbi:MAG: hypothetical protein M1825_000281 [Sarcosagium campestre]|nr:MAG: hypothetical protein M1825_000281 [Sarcosagium campestre]